MTRKQMRQALATHKERRAREEASARIERKTIEQAYWIETARDDEQDMGPYRLCCDGGQRFALSTNDAIRAQQQGVPFKAR